MAPNRSDVGRVLGGAMNRLVQTQRPPLFWRRGGALLEPTEALHRLLDHSDIGMEIPMAALSLPSRAINIIPPPAIRDRHNGLASPLIFDHLTPPNGPANRCVTFACAYGKYSSVFSPLQQCASTSAASWHQAL
jgi:hypothetical protein